MRSAGQTLDNPLLSEPSKADPGASHFRASTVNEPPSTLVEGYIHDSIAEATRRAYLFDLAHFEAWGGRIPCEPNVLAAYFAEHAETLAMATLVRRLAAIARAHQARGFPSPTQAEVVRATMRGVRRRCGKAQREARPLLRDELFRTLDRIGDSMKDARDRALLLVGFAAGFRRSELVGLDVPDIEIVPQGLVIHLRRSKTDQEGASRKIGVPFGRTRFCPVTALGLWRERSGFAEGPLFRPVDRNGRIAAARLSSEAISVIVKARVAAAGYDPARYSGHSLRAGLATSAAQAGVAPWRIRQQTGHASDAMLARYVRDGELFVDNAAGALL
jgi:integrase